MSMPGAAEAPRAFAAARSPGRAALAAGLPMAALAAAAAVGATALGAGVAPLRVAVLLLIAPLAEETLLRLGLHEPLLRRGVAAWRANLVAALAFTLAHLLLRGELAALAVVLPALLVGALWQCTRRLRDAVLLHATLNAFWLAAALADLLPRSMR